MNARQILTRAMSRSIAQGAQTFQNRTIENMTGAQCTLNGLPATVCGRLNRFATVAALDPSGPSAEFSWHTVANVLDKGGDFRT
jgi:hypothetical protein